MRLIIFQEYAVCIKRSFQICPLGVVGFLRVCILLQRRSIFARQSLKVVRSRLQNVLLDSLLLFLVKFLDQLGKHIRLSVYIFLNVTCPIYVDCGLKNCFNLRLWNFWVNSLTLVFLLLNSLKKFWTDIHLTSIWGLRFYSNYYLTVPFSILLHKVRRELLFLVLLNWFRWNSSFLWVLNAETSLFSIMIKQGLFKLLSFKNLIWRLWIFRWEHWIHMLKLCWSAAHDSTILLWSVFSRCLLTIDILILICYPLDLFLDCQASSESSLCCLRQSK